MSVPAQKLVRKQFLISSKAAKRLERIAAERGTSSSEIVRQAIESFDVNGAEAMGSGELMDLVSVRLKEAIRSTRNARRTAERALSTLSTGNAGG